jgi:hypothetical protein
MNKLPYDIVSIIVLMICEKVKCSGILRTVCKEWKEIIDIKYNNPINSMEWVTTVSAAEWARDHGCCMTSIGRWSARIGNLDMLKWSKVNNIPWKRWTCEIAAQGGHLEVFEWAHTEGCDWDELWVCMFASQHGHLNVLKWLNDNGYTRHNKWICVWAIQYGHLPAVKWAYDTLGKPKYDLLWIACDYNQLEVLKWLYSNKKSPLWQDKALLMLHAKKKNYLHIVQWIDEECAES